MRSSLLLSLVLAAPWLGACAGQECDLNSDCPNPGYCAFGRCERDCAADFDCADGLVCSEIGQCVNPNGVDAATPPRDSGLSRDSGIVRDSGLRDSGVAMDAGLRDSGLRDSGLASDSGLRDTGIGSDSGITSDAGPPTGPVARGTYRYGALPIGGGEGIRVAFHPDGSYAVILERYDVIHVYDWATRTTQTVNLDPPGSPHVYFHDVTFDPSGAFAYVVGAISDAGAETGVLFRMDDAMARGGMASAAFTQSSETRAGERFAALEYPLPPRTGPPVLLSTTTRSPYIARLRELDTATDTFMGLVTASPRSAGCMDLAFAENEFGDWGIVVVCGINGGDAPYYTEIGSPPYSWRPGPSATLGNVYRAASHPSGDYALAIGASGRGNLHRFEAGAWRAGSSSPSISRGLWGVTFQEGGQRAIAYGQAGGTPLTAPVVEYRHDLWSSAELTDVSIPGFDAAPYLGDSSTNLNDAAFRPGCDGGLIVGGKSDWRGTRGLVIEFRIEGLRSCGGTL